MLALFSGPAPTSAAMCATSSLVVCRCRRTGFILVVGGIILAAMLAYSLGWTGMR
jgi:hypothetical protein